MKILFSLILWAVFEFIQEVGWTAFACLLVYIFLDFIFFAFGFKTEFHFLRAVLLLCGLLLILLITHKLPNWIGK